ncbi:MAG: hypothetical protein ACLVGL_11615 [Waltera sp.]
MKKKIYLAVTVLLLTLAGIYVAARMILWGGPVSFRSYVLLLGDLLCLLLLLFYVYLRVPIRLHRKIRTSGNSRKWEWLEDIGIALWAVLCLIVTFAGIAWIWFENDIPSETRLTENLISVEEMEFPDRHWYSYWRPEGVLFRRETELAGEDYITYLTELMDKEENTHPEDAETVAKQAMEEQWLAEYYASETETAEDVQDPLEPYAQAVYDAVLQQQGFSFEVRYNAKGNFYLQLGEQEQAGKTYAYTLVYNRTSQNGKCEIFVLYRNLEENLSTEAAQIVEFYAVRSEDLQVIAGDKTGWSVVANSAYQEATGEK